MCPVSAGARGRLSINECCGPRSTALAAQGRAPSRSLIGRLAFVGLLLRRCQPLIGEVLTAGVKGAGSPVRSRCAPAASAAGRGRSPWEAGAGGSQSLRAGRAPCSRSRPHRVPTGFSVALL